MKPTLITLELNIFKKNFKNHRKQKYHNKYLNTTSIRLDNVRILLHWIIMLKGQSLLDYTNLFSPNV